MPSNNAAHNELVRLALQELAMAGITAWRHEVGAWKEPHSERRHPYGKTGHGDITVILPVLVQFASGVKRLVAWHGEAEAKTGKGVQNENQNLHEQFCVLKNGGFYILFRDTEYLMQQVKLLKST